MTLSDERIALSLDPKAKRVNGSWSCRCPAHEDNHASLSLSEKDGRLLWRCHAGCSQADVQAELQKRGLLGNGADTTASPRTKPDKTSDDWRPIAPVPDGAAEPGFTHAEYGKPTRTWAYRDADGRVLFHVARFDPAAGRKQIIPRCWGTLKGRIGWHWGHPATPRPLYGLDQLAARPADPVLVVEGEKTADAAAEILPGYVATTWPGGSNAAGMADWAALKGRCIMIWPDHDEPGRKAAEKIGDALLEIAAGVRIVDPPADLPESWDLADEAPDDLDVRALIDQAEHHVDRLERLVEDAETDPGAPFESEAIDFLATLRARDQAGYERTRARLKKAGVRIGALDQEVERRKPEATADDATGKGQALRLVDPDPWPERIDGAQLIGDIVAAIQRYVILPERTALSVALWTIHSHTMDFATVAPRLLITAPTRECGKTILLDTVSRLVPRPLPAANISPAGIFRTTELARPTLLIDEADTFLKDNDELRGVINSGHTQASAFVIRVVETGGDFEPRKFSTWCSIVICGIGSMPGTITSRSIVIKMERKMPGERVARLTHRTGQDLDVLCRKVARWVADNRVKLESIEPDIPEQLGNRTADNWHELLVIADAAGGEWPVKAREVAIARSSEDDAEVVAVQLLADIRVIFDDAGADKLLSSTIAGRLAEMEGQPWAEFNRARKPITTNAIARLLKVFKIAPGSIRPDIPGAGTKGYERKAFVEAWNRYLPPERNSTSGTTAQPTDSAAYRGFRTGTQNPDVPDANRPKPAQSAACASVPDGQPVQGRREELDF